MEIEMNVIVAVGYLVNNREEHLEEYKVQLEGWKVKMEEYSKIVMEWAAEGGQGERPIMTPKPKDFTEDYDRYINQLRHHIPDSIKIDEHEFKQIVENEFGWKHTFSAATQLYSSHAGSN